MEIENEILELMQRKDYVPLRVDELYKAIGGSGKVFSRLKKLLPRMVRDGKIAQVKRDRYCLPSDANLISGRIHFRFGGSAKLIPDTPADGSEPHPPVHIRAEDTGVALPGDHVVVRIEKKRRKGGFRESYAADDNFEFGTPASAVTYSKQKRTLLAAQAYLNEHSTKKMPRLDVIEVYLDKADNGVLKINHIEDAFGN